MAERNTGDQESTPPASHGDAPRRHIAVLTSGGDAPGMNAAIRAVVRSACGRGWRVDGVQDGYQGLVDGAFRPLGTRDVSNIIQLGGTILGTSRCARFETPEGRAEAMDNLRNHGVDALVVIGGNGSYQGAVVLHREHGFPVIGLPGTIDNDILGTNFTLGFDTAINTAIGAIDRIRDTANSLDRAFVIEVMGRRSGAIAITSAIAGGAEEVLVPERSGKEDAVLDRIRAAHARGKRSLIIVVAEGDASGRGAPFGERLKRELGISVRVTVLGHIQRGGSPTAFDRVLGSRMGVAAIKGLEAGETFAKVCIRGNSIVLAPLDETLKVQDALRAELLDVCHELAQ